MCVSFRIDVKCVCISVDHAFGTTVEPRFADTLIMRTLSEVPTIGLILPVYTLLEMRTPRIPYCEQRPVHRPVQDD